MTIEASTLDDLDTESKFAPYDSPAIRWNNHTLKLISDDYFKTENCVSILLAVKIGAIPQLICAKAIFHLDKDCEPIPLKVSSAVQPIWQPDSKKDHSEWAAAQHLVKHYLQKAHPPKESISYSANVTTVRISLSDLLSQEYLNSLNPPIPFFLPTELPVPSTPIFALPPLPEIALLNIPLTVNLQAIAAAQALATPLPVQLLRPKALLHSLNDSYYAKIQTEFYAKVEAECYAKLLAEHQAQICVAPAAVPLPEPSETTQISSPSYNQQFIQLIETKLTEANDPSYTEQFTRPAYNQQFVNLLESKLGETQDPIQYKEQLWKAAQGYAAGIQAIESFFKGREIALPSLTLEKPTAPFCEIPRLGYPDQRTVHFHCGISNTFASIVEGGLCLSTSLDKEFAIQPHLIHSDSLAKGLTLVAIEKLNERTQELLLSEVGTYLPEHLELPGTILQNSQIQQSIEYEVANLSMIAQNIVKTGNPNLKQVHVTFSNGGYVFKEALKQLPPEYQATIVVVTSGTTAIIENHLACRVYNIIGDKDQGSLHCNGGISGIEKAKAGATIQIIPQSEIQFGVGGHYFMQIDYQDRISKILKTEIIDNYEVY